MQSQLDEIESQLKTLGAGPGLLQLHLDYLVDVLANAENHLWSETATLVVNRMGIKQTEASVNAPELSLTRIHSSAGWQLVVRLVDIVPDLLQQTRH